jgi:hypothetical protein
MYLLFKNRSLGLWIYGSLFAAEYSLWIEIGIEILAD